MKNARSKPMSVVRRSLARGAIGVVALVLASCSTAAPSATGARVTPGAGGSSDLNVGAGGASTSSGSGTDLNLGGGAGPVANGQPFGCPSSLSGTVYDPSGKLPLYNVVLYVPSEALAPIANGASCQTCDGNFSGHPIAATLSDAAGHFQLKLDNVPAGDTIPLVAQVGKWRRQINVPGVKACADTEAPAASVQRRVPSNACGSTATPWSRVSR